MVKDPFLDARSAERALAVGYAPAADRRALSALLALDRRLGELVAGSREPLVAQMRLTWWFEALRRLDAAPPPAEPVLAALAAEVLPRGVTGATLAAMVDGWEALLDEPLDETALDRFARERGGGLFLAAARLFGATSPEAARARTAAAGEGWALADLAGRISDADAAGRAADRAAVRLAAAFAGRWPRPPRPLGALALLARADLAGTPPGSPRRVARLLGHRLTGR